MGYYVDAYVSSLVKASLAAPSAATAAFGQDHHLAPVSLNNGPKSTGWNVNETPGASRSAQHILPPLMNRGYYARVQAIRAALKHFLSNLGGRQVVSLGAGFDSTYFVLKDEGFNIDKYIEIDVIDTVMKKASAIRGRQNLFKKHLPNLAFRSTGEISSDSYSLLGCDLRDLAALDKVIASSGLDLNFPTLFLSECVLIYMTVEESAALIAWTSEKFPVSHFVLYEQVEPHDNFGKAMLDNLKQRGCPLLSIMAYPTLQDQKKRFQGLGWDYVEVQDMDYIFEHVVAKDPEERKRVFALEFMDELEEWQLMHRHYCIALASHHSLFGSAADSSAPSSSQSTSCRTDWQLRFEDLVVPVGPHRETKPGHRPGMGRNID